MKKINSKKLFSSSIFFFIGAILSLATILVLREFSAFAFVVIDFLPEIALGIFLLSLSKSAEPSFINKAKKILSVIFVICLANAVFQLIADIVFMVMLELSEVHEGLFRFFELSSYLKFLPFARILSDIPALLRGFLNPFFAVSLLGDALVLVGFIRALAVLSKESKQNGKETASEQGDELSEISENSDLPKNSKS